MAIPLKSINDRLNQSFKEGYPTNRLRMIGDFYRTTSPDASSDISDLQLNMPVLNLSQNNGYPEFCGFYSVQPGRSWDSASNKAMISPFISFPSDHALLSHHLIPHSLSY
jgi:hypothetical protein